MHFIHKGASIFFWQTCYLHSERCGWGRSFGGSRFLVVFDLNSASCSSACLFVGTIANKMTLFSTFEALACLPIFFMFFVICSFADDSRSVHSIVISRGKTRSRRCMISWSAPVLIVRSGVVASRATPDPSRSLPLSLSLGAIVESSIFWMKWLGFQVNLLLTLNCGPLLFIGLRVFHFDISVSKWSWKTKGESSKIRVVVHVYVST